MNKESEINDLKKKINDLKKGIEQNILNLESVINDFALNVNEKNLHFFKLLSERLNEYKFNSKNVDNKDFIVRINNIIKILV